MAGRRWCYLRVLEICRRAKGDEITSLFRNVSDVCSRYANMDYIFGSAIQGFKLLFILISYDIACQWFTNLFERMTEYWPTELQVPSTTKLIPAIPKLHEPMHEAANHQVYSLNYIPGVGQSDLECPVRVWAAHNIVGNATKTQGPGSRHDVLDDHFSFWNWLKYVGMGKTLMRRYRSALADRNVQVEGHRGLSASLADETVKKWESICAAWENDNFPKKTKNPYHTEGIGKSVHTSVSFFILRVIPLSPY